MNLQNKHGKRYAVGNWDHLFGPGKGSTTCAIVVDLENKRLVAAQMGYTPLAAGWFEDLEESVIEANMAHDDPEGWGAELTNELPSWVVRTPEQLREGEALFIKERLERDIARLRTLIEGPEFIRWCPDMEIVIRPRTEDPRLTVIRDGMGHSTVNYTEQGVSVEVCRDDGERIYSGSWNVDAIEYPAIPF